MLSLENNVDEIQIKILSQLDKAELIKAINVGLNDLKMLSNKENFRGKKKKEIALVKATLNSLIQEYERRFYQ
jgi:hypothetical protein